MRLRRSWLIPIVGALILASVPVVRAQVGQNGQTAPVATRSARFMTYNIQWLAENENPDRIKNLKSVIGNIKPDILTVQEVASLKALRQVFDQNYEIAILDDPKEAQEVAVIVKKPWKIESSGLVFTDPQLDFAFPGKRDVMRAVVVNPNGDKLTVYSTHMKSRRGGRATTDPQREQHASLLAAFIKEKNESHVVIGGDMNDAPDDRSVNILETGDPKAPAGRVTPKLMVNVCDRLNEQDYVTIGMSFYFRGQALTPISRGAKADNDRLRGKDYEFPRDVKVRESFFDNILVSPPLFRVSPPTATVYGGADALRGRGGRVNVPDSGPVEYVEKGDRASDHLPVYYDIRFP